jgi:uncharacterized protein YhfF
MTIPSKCQRFWEEFCSTRNEDPTPKFLEAFHFDDNEPSANELAELVLSGTKRASAALLWAYEHANARLPQTGDLSIVTRFDGEPVCVIETGRVEVVAFSQVDEGFAATEGEGDKSLAFWRRAHEAYFGRECDRIGREPHPQMPVVCERFEVVFRSAQNREA